MDLADNRTNAVHGRIREHRELGTSTSIFIKST